MEDLKEIKCLRKEREKHFLKSDGTMIAQMYSDDIHYLDNEKYVEIDNTLEVRDNYILNKRNIFQTKFNVITKPNELLYIEKKDYYISIYIKNQNSVQSIICDNNIRYENILDGIDLNYNILSTKIKEDIILNEKGNIPEKIEFIIDTNLILKIENKNIIAMDNDENIVFTIEPPFMVDAKEKYNNEIYYNLKQLNSSYLLSLELDNKWIDNADFPVIIDPTITSNGQNKNVYDTYIYQCDTSINRNNQDVLKIGVEKVNDEIIMNRALVKFDLPTIGTGSQIIDAEAVLVGYGVLKPDIKKDIIVAHNINNDWNEETANWNTMNDKYDSKIEDYTWINMSTSILGDVIDVAFNRINITNLVKHWYSGMPNYGFMLKSYREEYKSDIPAAKCFSKNNAVQGYNPKPYLIIHYRNQNGLENYMEYKEHNFTDGTGYLNLYNGNLTELFEVGKTIGGKFPVRLDLIYNTNDVILKHNYGYGLGYKLNMHQEIKKIVIEDATLLEYLDADGTLHYFYKGSDLNTTVKDENAYYDEDGLSLTISIEGDNYLIKDSDGNNSLFVKNGSVWYLKELTDTSKNKIEIYYDANNKISKIKDANNSEILLTYLENSIVVNSPSDTVTLLYNSNKQLSSISTVNGITDIAYNNNNIINKIVDVNGKSMEFDYNQTIPYRLSKITEYGLNNTIGKYCDIKYEFNVTVLIDEHNRLETYTFNNEGNNVGVVSSDADENIQNSYGKQSIYNKRYATDLGTGKINKLTSDKGYAKTINNYIENSSFEEDIPMVFSTPKLKEEIVEGISVTGKHSLKVSTPNTWESKKMQFTVPKNKYYTFSAYIKNNGDLKIDFYYLDNEQKVHSDSIFPLSKSENFSRTSLTIFYPDDANSDLFLEITFIDNGIFYIDDMQLEEGEIANLYNIISNSNFEDGLKNWKISSYKSNDVAMTPMDSNHSIVKLKSGFSALKLIGEPDKSETLERVIPIAGKKGDVFDLYFWYKNNGSSTQYGPVSRHALITFNYVEGAPPIDTFPQIAFNTDNNKWQLFHDNFKASYDYTSIKIIIFNVESVNELYLTNFSLFKATGQDNLVYDNYGNLKEYYDSRKQIHKYEYDKNNQVISMMDNEENKLVYEYDNSIKDRVLRGVSAMGITHETRYDKFGNIIKNKIFKTMSSSELGSNNYYIRQKGTNKFLTPNIVKTNVEVLENECSNYVWKLEKTDNIYKILSVELLNYGLNYYDNKIILSKGDKTNFELIKNKNGSYIIKVENKPLYVTNKNNVLELSSLMDENENQQFYLEEQSSKLFIENNSTYTLDGKFIKSTTDSLGRITNYNIDNRTGLVSSITDPNGKTITYTYNDKNQIIKAEKENRTVNYQYNSQNLLSKIIFGNKEYKFLYDDFFNPKQILIGNNTLITNGYGKNNGNLLVSAYGNGNNISYEYDELDRLKREIYPDKEYLYYYNNLGDVAKILSTRDKYYYDYDNFKRLIQYKNGYFKINYSYGNNNVITQKNYKCNMLEKVINYEYNNDDRIIKMQTDDIVLNCTYDELERPKNKNIGDYKISYNYINHGNKSSFMLENFTNQSNDFKYVYDNLNNIVDIYQNNNLINHYDYNEHNELVKDVDYTTNIVTDYVYDNVGNLVSRQKYDINSNNLLKTDNYEYSNLNWEDQLTKYNDSEILYDNIGNPIKIGNSNLIWKNGRQLSSYQNDNLNVSYEYNIESIRTSKTINNITTKYYVDDNRIIVEEIGNNVLYYIRDDNDNLVAFKYNDTLYYYLKNGQGDIIGLLDKDYNEIVKYQYDAWGQIIKITDNNENIITDNNHIAHINPFRYRGYYYDRETNLYYLNSRYYNPVWGRFINADNYVSTDTGLLGHNMYTYSNNNPIIYFDPSGHAIILGMLAVIAGAGALILGNTIYQNSKSKKEIKKVQKKKAPDKTKELNRKLKQSVSELSTATAGQNPVQKLATFTNAVKTGSKYDLKSQRAWQTTISYNNVIMEAQDIGNFHFGYIGRSMGYSTEFLVMGAGVNQLYKHTKEPVTYKNCLTLSFCDDPRDTYYIRMGAIAYDNEN